MRLNELLEHRCQGRVGLAAVHTHGLQPVAEWRALEPAQRLDGPLAKIIPLPPRWPLARGGGGGEGIGGRRSERHRGQQPVNRRGFGPQHVDSISHLSQGGADEGDGGHNDRDGEKGGDLHLLCFTCLC